MKLKDIVFDLPIRDDEIDALITERTSGQMISAELVEPQAVRKRDAYNRFRDLAKKESFKQHLLDTLYQKFVDEFGAIHAKQLIGQFKLLAENIEQDGAITLGNVINYDAFSELIAHYDERLATDGSQSWIHSYINLGNYPDFLSHPKFHQAFLHPLLVALIAYSSGGPIRIVDARGKDAEPLTVQAQDNMLHIDNTPFRQEFKIILTWERGKVSGPKGQNFVFIPGTHKGLRNCQVSASGQAWSTEDGSIFTTSNAIDRIFALQEKILPGQSPAVVEVTHPDMPLTTLFRAGELIHHRYRTKEKNVPRSCVILAFHRAEDNPGQFLDKSLLQGTEQMSLPHLLMGPSSYISEETFLKVLANNSEHIADTLKQINTISAENTAILSYKSRTLNRDELLQWKSIVTGAPTVEDIKKQAALVKLNTPLSKDLLLEMMKYDKHGPLDLILYEDGHEEIRKWARNRIREMPLLRLQNRIQQFDEWELYRTPHVNDLLQPGRLKDISAQLVQFIDALSLEAKMSASLNAQEKISSQDAFRSIKQLIADLGEAIGRCTSRQTFLSTSLFLLWACDELHCLLIGNEKTPLPKLMTLSSELMSNYLTTYILIEKQMQLEQSRVLQDKVNANFRYRFYSPVVTPKLPVADTPTENYEMAKY